MMWIGEKEWTALKERVAAIEKEQLLIKKYIEENANNDKQLIANIKGYRDEIEKLLETLNTNVAESVTDWGKG